MAVESFFAGAGFFAGAAAGFAVVSFAAAAFVVDFLPLLFLGAALVVSDFAAGFAAAGAAAGARPTPQDVSNRA